MTQAIVKPSATKPSSPSLAAAAIAKPEVVWEKLPANFILPDDPVESIAQPFLAAALTESLDLAGRITSESLIASNMAIVAKVDKKTNVKAPDWFYVGNTIPLSGGVIRRSYSPHIDGEIPAIVMEFLSEEETGEYSMRPIFPYGKMWFYEQILQVPVYVIFDPEDGRLEIRTLDSTGKYELQPLDEYGKYFIESLELYLGTWFGKRQDQTFYWLRWWGADDRLLYWGTEKIAQEQLLRKAETQRAEEQQQRANLAEQEILRLRELLANK